MGQHENEKVKRHKSIIGSIMGSISRKKKGPDFDDNASIHSVQSGRSRLSSVTVNVSPVKENKPEPLPPSESIDEAFSQMIEQFGGLKLEHSNLGLTEKWQMVQNARKMGPKKQGSPLEIIEELNRCISTGNLDENVLQEFRVGVTSEPISWIKEFILLKGWDVFLKIARIVALNMADSNAKKEKLAGEIVRAYKSFSSCAVGLNRVVEDEESITLGVLFLGDSNRLIRHAIVQLLAVFCLSNTPTSHSRLWNCLRISSKLLGEAFICERFMHRFEADINSSEEPTPQKVRYFLDSFILINSLISTVESLKERVLYRNLLIKNSLRNSFVHLYQIGEASLDRQLDFFFEDMKLDLESMAQEFQYRNRKELQIFENEEENELANSIIDYIDFDSLSRKNHLKLVNSLVADICLAQVGNHLDLVHHKSLPTFDTQLLVQIFEKQINLEWKEKFELISRQKELLEVSFAEQTSKIRNDYESKIAILQKDIGVMHGQSEHEKQIVKSLEEKLENLNSKIQSYESLELKRKESLISEISQSFPINDIKENTILHDKIHEEEIVRTIQPKPPTPPPLPPLPLCSTSKIETKLTSSSIPVFPIISDNLPSATAHTCSSPNTTLIPPPPPPFGPAPPQYHTMLIHTSERKKIPNIKMRNLQWRKVLESKIPGSIWEKMNDLKWEERLDYLQLEKNFPAKKEDEVKNKVEKKGFLSSKIQTNLGIVLNRIKCPPATCRKALKLMDMSIFDDQIISELLKIDLDKRSKEDLEKRLLEEDDWSVLPFAEQFLLCMYSLPFYEQRLRCWNLKNAFSEWFVDVREVPIYRLKLLGK
jgi:hypothetical protein